MPHKNDYSVIVFMEDGTPKKWNFVHNLGGFASFLNKAHSNWKYLNVYDRRKGSYLKRFYKGNFIPPFLTALVFALTFTFFLTFKKFASITFNNDFNNTATIPTNAIAKGGVKC